MGPHWVGVCMCAAGLLIRISLQPVDACVHMQALSDPPQNRRIQVWGMAQCSFMHNLCDPLVDRVGTGVGDLHAMHQSVELQAERAMRHASHNWSVRVLEGLRQVLLRKGTVHGIVIWPILRFQPLVVSLMYGDRFIICLLYTSPSPRD